MSDLFTSFSRAMTRIAGLFPPRSLGLAVSGGVDSMALASLSARWAEERGVVLNAYVADHKLRSNSTEEANEVAHYLESRLGIHPHILTLTELSNAITRSGGNKIEEEARLARRNSLYNACINRKDSHVLMGHHLNDQVELFILRLIHGSSWFGLGGMIESAPMPMLQRDPHNPPKLCLGRPLLNTPKKDLIEYCMSNQIRWWEDPTNADPTLTERNLVRRMYHLGVEPSGLQLDKIVPLQQLFSEQRAKATEITETAYEELLLAGQLDYRKNEGTAALKITEEVSALPETVLSELLLKIAAPISPLPLEKLATRRRKLDSVGELIRKGRSFERNTLGVAFKYDPKSQLLRTSRERPRPQETQLEIFRVSPEWSEWTLIDNRFFIRWKLLNHSNNNNNFIEARLLTDERPLLPLLKTMFGQPVVDHLKPYITTHPLFAWSAAADAHTISRSKLIGFPTLGVTKDVQFEVKPKICIL